MNNIKLIKKTVLVFIVFMTVIEAMAQVRPYNLKCEYLTNPRGIDITDPRFYWQLDSKEEGQFQTAYQILVSTSIEKLNNNIGDAFDSKKVKSNQNTHVVYKGKKLKPSSDYFWKIRVWDKHSKTSGWSKTADFSTGLFENEDWKDARWIAWKPQEEWENAWWKRKEIEEQCFELHLPSYFGARMSMWERYLFHYENPYDPAPLMRKEFNTEKKIKSAIAFIAGIGYYELYINGEKVGDHVLDPGWTNYKQTVLYVTYDVTKYFKKGENAIGVMLGRGNYGLLADDHWGFWKKGGYIGQPKVKCRFKVIYTDGTENNIISDLSWKVKGGPIVYDGPHMGEIYDATKEVSGWNKTGLNTSDWDIVKAAPDPGGVLRAQLNEPIRIVSKFQPVKVRKEGWQGDIWGDTGTNMAGWINIKINAPKGTRIIVYFGEKENVMDLDQPGGLQQMAYIAKGEPGEVASCRFSYKGFRYFLIKGHKNPLTKNDIEICQVNSDVNQVGHFLCSDTTINAIHKICDKSMISNLHSIPTDCPHREKNGWMGDAVTGIEMGMGNYDLAALITKFIRDIYDGQNKETGALSVIAPDSRYASGMSPLWGSAGIQLPWYMYTYYGDTRIIEQYWNKMMHFVESVWNLNQVKGNSGMFTDVLSDWSSPFGNQPDEGEEVYVTMNYYQVLNRMIKMAKIISKKEDIKSLQKKADIVRESVYYNFYNKKLKRFEGIDSTGYRQGPNALALFYGLVKPEHKEKIIKDLIQDITINRDMHIYGGIFTGLVIWELLPQLGYSDIACKVALNDTYPGYGYMLKNGATTLWEHWPDEASHIHYFMGFIDNFFYRYLAGINFDISNPGFSKIVFHPEFVKELNFVKASYNSIYGEIKAEWKKTGENEYEYNVTVPVNCDAEVVLPGGKTKISSGVHKMKISINDSLITTFSKKSD